MLTLFFVNWIEVHPVIHLLAVLNMLAGLLMSSHRLLNLFETLRFGGGMRPWFVMSMLAYLIVGWIWIAIDFCKVGKIRREVQVYEKEEI